MLHLNMGDQIRNHELWLDYSHGRIIYIYIYIPVGGFNPSEKHQSMDRIIPYIMENPPTPADARGSALGNNTFDPGFGLVPLLYSIG